MAREDPPLLERESELAVVTRSLAAARDGVGGVVVLEGPAGIGKTRLLRAACDDARSAGMTVLRARGGELERGSPFGVVRQLYEATLHRAPVEDRDALLDGPAALAAPLLGEAPDGWTAPPLGDASAALHGLFWLTANLAERRPLLLCVDDAHWADEASLRLLAYLARRVEALPVVLVVACRSDEPGAGSGPLDVLREDRLVVRLRPAALSAPAAAVLVRSVLSPAADAAFCDACATATGGNPLLLRMLADALRDEEVAATAADQDRVAALAAQVAAVSVLPRLRRLSADAAAFAGAVAVMGDRVELRHAAGLADLPVTPATRAADALAAAAILVPRRPLDFVHPTVRRAVYESLPAAERHRMHRLAADILDRERAPVDRVAAHLVATECLGDEWVVEVLRAAARPALARGAVEEAARYLHRALVEPPAPEVRSEVLFEIGSALARTRTTDACRYLEEALEASTRNADRAAIALELARVMGTGRDTRSAIAVLGRAMATIGEVDPALRLRLEATYISVGRRYPATRASVTRRLRELAPLAEPDSPAGCLLLVDLAAEALEEHGSVEEAGRLAGAALRNGHLLLAGETDAALMASGVLMSTDRLDAAWHAWNAELDRARRIGSIMGFAYAAGTRAYLAYRCGRLSDAEADAQLAYDVHTEQRLELPRRYSLAFLVGALVERGEVATAAERLDTAGVSMNLSLLLDSRARLRCGQGRFEDAVEDFLEAGRRLTARGTRHPGILAWRSSAALALLHLDQPREARRLAEEELELARRLGVPRALGVALRAVGLIRGGAPGLALLEQAATALASSSARLEQGRALADYGGALRRANRRAESREPLRRALDLARCCGATPLAERVRQELAAAGVRPRRPASGVDALTPSELRVAGMAAEGMSNRAIAQALFVTVKTVEIHLRSAYRKLAVSSRTELPAELARGRAERSSRAGAH
jgi:DNA-binding CsgD family transcriptional regulator